MKIALPTILTLLITIAGTCTNKTDSVDSLNGKWTMVSYSAFMPEMPVFSDGDVVWEFNTKKSTLDILIKKPEQHSFMGFETGNQKYTKGPKSINIGGSKYFYSIMDGKLKLDSNTDPRLSKDLPVITFKRYE